MAIVIGGCMVFVFQIGAEKVAETKMATESKPVLYWSGTLGHTLLVAVAKNVVQNPEVKNAGKNEDGKTSNMPKQWENIL